MFREFLIEKLNIVANSLSPCHHIVFIYSTSYFLLNMAFKMSIRIDHFEIFLKTFLNRYFSSNNFVSGFWELNTYFWFNGQLCISRNKIGTRWWINFVEKPAQFPSANVLHNWPEVSFVPMTTWRDYPTDASFVLVTTWRDYPTDACVAWNAVASTTFLPG